MIALGVIELEFCRDRSREVFHIEPRSLHSNSFFLCISNYTNDEQWLQQQQQQVCRRTLCNMRIPCDERTTRYAVEYITFNNCSNSMRSKAEFDLIEHSSPGRSEPITKALQKKPKLQKMCIRF